MPASKHQTSKQGSGHRQPPELRRRPVRMVEETINETGERHGVVTRVAVQLGLGSETLRHWVKQAEIDGVSDRGRRPKSASGSASWSGRSESCGGPTRS